MDFSSEANPSNLHVVNSKPEISHQPSIKQTSPKTLSPICTPHLTFTSQNLFCKNPSPKLWANVNTIKLDQDLMKIPQSPLEPIYLNNTKRKLDPHWNSNPKNKTNSPFLEAQPNSKSLNELSTSFNPFTDNPTLTFSNFDLPISTHYSHTSSLNSCNEVSMLPYHSTISNRNFFTITRSMNGCPVLHKSSRNSVSITEISEDGSEIPLDSCLELPNLHSNSKDPKGSRK